MKEKNFSLLSSKIVKAQIRSAISRTRDCVGEKYPIYCSNIPKHSHLGNSSIPFIIAQALLAINPKISGMQSIATIRG